MLELGNSFEQTHIWFSTHLIFILIFHLLAERSLHLFDIPSLSLRAISPKDFLVLSASEETALCVIICLKSTTASKLIFIYTFEPLIGG